MQQNFMRYLKSRMMVVAMSLTLVMSQTQLDAADKPDKPEKEQQQGRKNQQRSVPMRQGQGQGQGARPGQEQTGPGRGQGQPGVPETAKERREDAKEKRAGDGNDRNDRDAVQGQHPKLDTKTTP